MAGTITHLVIADKLLGRLSPEVLGTIADIPLFFCGNLAPDAIMAREGYVREMKKFTHFKDGIGEDELAVPEKYALYRSRLQAFRDKHVVLGSRDYELYLGYVTHMLADEVFVLRVRDRHVEEMRRLAGDGGMDYESYFRQFGRDVDLNDWRLLREYHFSRDVLSDIQSRTDYEIDGMITQSELASSKAYIIRKNFLTSHPLDEKPRYLTYEENAAYIEWAVDEILRRL
jgi:hypothetical protein